MQKARIAGEKEPVLDTNLHSQDSNNEDDDECNNPSLDSRIYDGKNDNSSAIDPLNSNGREEEFNPPYTQNSESSPESKAESDPDKSTLEKESPNSTKMPTKSAEGPAELFSIRRDGLALAKRFARVHITIMLVYFALMSVYWGAIYHREDRVKNMGILVAIEDEGVVLSNGTSAEGIFSEPFSQLLAELPTLGRFEYANMTKIAAEAARSNSTVFEAVCAEVHRQKYWAAFYINATASQTVYEFLTLNSTESSTMDAPHYLILAVYETGRHYLALSQYVTKNLRKLSARWLEQFAGAQYAQAVLKLLTLAQRTQFLKRAAAGAPLALPLFNLVDLRPATLTAVLGPSELGLVYSMIFSFHQFNFSADLHNIIGEQLRFRHYLWYRVLFSQLNHLILALVYGLMTLAFQVPVNVALGRSGFAVLWFTMFLFISALGGLNEIMITCINTWATKALLPPWMIFSIVTNISPTFAPLVLSPGFYRYGYAMPMFNAYEALRVVFFNTWRGSLGRNYGILAAWVILTNIVLCYVLKIVNDRKKRQAMEKATMEEKARIPNRPGRG